MLLALDIGNTAVKGGLFEGPEPTRVFHVDVGPAEPTRRASAEAWRGALREQIGDIRIDRVGVATVVPGALSAAETVLRELTGAPVTPIHAQMRLPFELAYETPQTLGADRLAAAAAAWTHYGRASEPPRSVVAIDAGTALTYEVIDRSGTYRGGVIAPGPVLVQRALRTGTAQLPTVPLSFPADVVGRSTRTAMQSGIMWGFVDGVQGMIDRLRARLPDPPVVVGTGGWGDVLARRINAIDHLAPHLVLQGVQVLIEMNEDAAAGR